LTGKDRKPISSEYLDYILGPIANYFKDQKIGSLTINFDLIRLGAWEYLPEEQEKYPSEIPCELSCREFTSDGTVIARGNVHENANGKAFVNTAQNLIYVISYRIYLTRISHEIVVTVWSTLGYFNEHKDFPIDKELHYGEQR